MSSANPMPVCQTAGCTRNATPGGNTCRTHGGRKRCTIAGCKKFAQAPTLYCKSHGGGYRCQYPECERSAASSVYRCENHVQDISHVQPLQTPCVRACQTEGCQERSKVMAYLCKTHGGGKRCMYTGCSKSASGRTNLCVAHGGGRRCMKLNCSKSAVGTTPYCVQHGGGRRCAVANCSRSARSGTEFCQAHRREDEFGVSKRTRPLSREVPASSATTKDTPPPPAGYVATSVDALAGDVQRKVEDAQAMDASTGPSSTTDRNGDSIVKTSHGGQTLLDKHENQQSMSRGGGDITANNNLHAVVATIAPPQPPSLESETRQQDAIREERASKRARFSNLLV